ncbi:hypothetical protein EYC80_002437 [Monilinia laxa]|uniref:Uncharacterized protein n=1 Tax=Monilinia laxa TaxID=61186 RepID=A0A5N6K424_MONLA|nr:hypothetical protein EYC80_002437 [Monilinia laxa]
MTPGYNAIIFSIHILLLSSQPETQGRQSMHLGGVKGIHLYITHLHTTCLHITHQITTKISPGGFILGLGFCLILLISRFVARKKGGTEIGEDENLRIMK